MWTGGRTCPVDGGGSHRGRPSRTRARLPPLGTRPSPPFLPGATREGRVLRHSILVSFFTEAPGSQRCLNASPREPRASAWVQPGAPGRVHCSSRAAVRARGSISTQSRAVRRLGPTAQEWVGWLLQQPGAGGPAQARASHKSPGYRGRGLMGRFSRQTPAPTLRPCWPPGPASTPAPLTGTALLARRVSRVL